MSCLTEHALKSLISRIGPRMKLLKVIKTMNEGSNCSLSSSSISSFQSDSNSESGSSIASLSDQVIQVHNQEKTSGPQSSTYKVSMSNIVFTL